MFFYCRSRVEISSSQGHHNAALHPPGELEGAGQRPAGRVRRIPRESGTRGGAAERARRARRHSGAEEGRPAARRPFGRVLQHVQSVGFRLGPVQ